MIGALFTLTVRQLLGRRRTLALALVVALPVAIAALYRVSGTDDPSVSSAEVSVGLASRLVISVLLPLVALVLGTSALGGEVEDGTAVFLLAKPIARWKIFAVKVMVASVATALLVVPSAMATVAVTRGSVTADGLMAGFGLAAFVGSVLYCAVFVALSAFTSRALIVGLVYVFVWETTITALFGALRWVSIREYANGWADLLITLDADVFDARLATGSALVASCVVLVLAVVFGIRALERFEIGERA